MEFLLLQSVAVTFNVAHAISQVRHEEMQDERPINPAKFHVDIYTHPKTKFSCDGRQAGEYYADPEAKCKLTKTKLLKFTNYYKE